MVPRRCRGRVSSVFFLSLVGGGAKAMGGPDFSLARRVVHLLTTQWHRLWVNSSVWRGGDSSR